MLLSQSAGIMDTGLIALQWLMQAVLLLISVGGMGLQEVRCGSMINRTLELLFIAAKGR